MPYSSGPWQFTANMYGIDNMRVFGVEEINDGITQGVANCGYGKGCEANARLIATAPELLKVVQDFIYTLQDEHGSYYVDGNIIKGKALWEKATGETWKDEELQEDEDDDEVEVEGEQS
jgi:hypothetical protein